MGEDLVGKIKTIPEVGEGSPETGFAAAVTGEKFESLGPNSNKNKAILRLDADTRLARCVQYQKDVDAFR